MAYRIEDRKRILIGGPEDTRKPTTVSTKKDTYGNMGPGGWQPNQNVPSAQQSIAPSTKKSSRKRKSSQSSQDYYMPTELPQSVAPPIETTEQFNQQPQSAPVMRQPQQQSQSIAPPIEQTISEGSYISQHGKFEFSFFSSQGQKERLTNVYQTLNSAFNPFAKTDVNANVNSPFLKKGLEAFANNPYEAALYVTGVSSAYKLVTGLSTKGGAIATGTLITGDAAIAASGARVAPRVLKAGTVAVNTANVAIRTNKVVPIIQGTAKNWKFVTGTMGTWIMTGVLSQNEWGDTIQGLNIGIGQLAKAGDVEGVRELKEYMDDITPEKMEWYLGPFAYAGNVGKKIESGILIAQKLSDQTEKDYAIAKSSSDILVKINDGTATNEEKAQFAKDNPFSPEAKAWGDAQRNLDAQGNSVFGEIDEEGNYIPSPTEDAKAEWEAENENKDVNGNDLFGHINENGVYVPSYTELAKRLESQQYYNSLQGGGAGGEQKFEPPSSLNFGLLRTSGGYEEGADETDNSNSVSQYYYGQDYNELDDVFRERIDEILRG